MSTERMREDFEKFRDERNATLESEGHKPGSKWHVTNAHYPTWQASRAAIEVELPSSASIHNTEVIKAVGRHIIAQGFKVKAKS